MHRPDETHLLVDLILSARPRQWVKNAFVLAAPLFSGHLFLRPDLITALAATVVFTMASCAIYLVNDIIDRQQDRLHPRKAQRPIASGRLSPISAGITALLLVLVALPSAWVLAVNFAVVVGVYILGQLAYSLWLKDAVLIDVFIIATGFMLRAVGGALVIQVPISAWFVLCTFTLTLLLATVKRRQELIDLGRQASQHRTSLGGYDIDYLDQVVGILASASIVCYALYAVDVGESSTLQGEMGWTMPLVLYGILRYLYIVRRLDVGGDPTALLWRDRPLQLTVALWALVSAGVVYYAN